MGNDTRIGVFICHCGSNIAGFLAVPELAEYVQTLPEVVYVQENRYSCSEGGLKEIQRAIKEHNLNRVVVAACTPRTHEPLFRDTCREVGLNPFLFEMCNIRDQCSWVHMKAREAATEKAKDLLRMSIARAKLLQPQTEIEVAVEPTVMVIGGGIAGLSAALNLANCGFQVKLIEREDKLGGLLNKLYKLHLTHEEAQDILQRRIKAVENHPNVEVYTRALLTELQGFIGNYQATINQEGRFHTFPVGVVIVATGAQVLQPVGYYNYDGQKIITQLELEEKLRAAPLKEQDIVMIQCVGAREPDRPYCSRICCSIAIKNALLIKEQNPSSNVFILYRDIQTHGSEFEDYYLEARKKGIIFLHYSLESPPIVQGNVIKVYSNMIGEEIEIPYDLVVLSTPLISQPDSETLAKLLKVPRDKDGFFFEAHAKLRPVEFATDGVYLCGSARWPAFIEEAIFQAEGAASRAAIPMANRSVKVEPIVASINAEICRGCGRCVEACPYQAYELVEAEGRWTKAEINPVLCKGCGVCAVVCPSGAITTQHFTDEQIESMLTVAIS
jgi:heterodisulfide reductase subunit A